MEASPPRSMSQSPYGNDNPRRLIRAPSHFFCPLGFNLLRGDAVRTATGHTFNEDALDVFIQVFQYVPFQPLEKDTPANLKKQLTKVPAAASAALEHARKHPELARDWHPPVWPNPGDTCFTRENFHQCFGCGTDKMKSIMLKKYSCKLCGGVYCFDCTNIEVVVNAAAFSVPLPAHLQDGAWALCCNACFMHGHKLHAFHQQRQRDSSGAASVIRNALSPRALWDGAVAVGKYLGSFGRASTKVATSGITEAMEASHGRQIGDDGGDDDDLPEVRRQREELRRQHEQQQWRAAGGGGRKKDDPFDQECDDDDHRGAMGRQPHDEGDDVDDTATSVAHANDRSGASEWQQRPGGAAPPKVRRTCASDVIWDPPAQPPRRPQQPVPTARDDDDDDLDSHNKAKAWLKEVESSDPHLFPASSAAMPAVVATPSGDAHQAGQSPPAARPSAPVAAAPAPSPAVARGPNGDDAGPRMPVEASSAPPQAAAASPPTTEHAAHAALPQKADPPAPLPTPPTAPAKAAVAEAVATSTTAAGAAHPASVEFTAVDTMWRDTGRYYGGAAATGGSYDLEELLNPSVVKYSPFAVPPPPSLPSVTPRQPATTAPPASAPDRGATTDAAAAPPHQGVVEQAATTPSAANDLAQPTAQAAPEAAAAAPHSTTPAPTSAAAASAWVAPSPPAAETGWSAAGPSLFTDDILLGVSRPIGIPLPRALPPAQDDFQFI